MQATCNGLKGNLGDIVDINQLSCYLILNGKRKKRSKDKGKPELPRKRVVTAFSFFRSSFSGCNGLIFDLCKVCFFLYANRILRAASGRVSPQNVLLFAVLFQNPKESDFLFKFFRACSQRFRQVIRIWYI